MEKFCISFILSMIRLETLVDVRNSVMESLCGKEPCYFIHLLDAPTHPPVCEKHCRWAAEQK